MATLDSLNDLFNEASNKLNLAAEEIKDVPLEPTQDNVRRIGEALVNIFEIQHQIYKIRPDLKPSFLNNEKPTPDPDLTEEQKALVETLSQKELQEIDNALLSNADHIWQKVAKVVGFTMMNMQNRKKGIPDVFYSQRVRKLVKEGRLESEGNLHYMGRSEVRIPQDRT